jgi:protocatechuate 3,4-dioxygenase beta subunit
MDKSTNIYDFDDLRSCIQNAKGIEEQSALRDLLTDLRHVADDLNLDFDFALEGSREVYIEEKERKPFLNVPD